MGHKKSSHSIPKKDCIYRLKIDTKKKLVSFINMTEKQHSRTEQLSPLFNKKEAGRFIESTTII